MNEHLRERGLHVKDLSKDLRDGILLCNLCEVISGKSIGRFNKHPKVPMQKQENCSMVISFLEAEGIKLVNIGGPDIFEGRMKLILGLLWTIILRYQINKSGRSDYEDELLKWVQSKIPEYGVTNFTSSWNDGRAINGLVHALQPDLCQNHSSLKPADSLDNARQGITTARDKMNVAALVLPEEMVHPKVDKLAMMTYISQFRDLHDLNDAARCTAYGKGLQEGIVNIPSSFEVFVPPDAKGKLEVRVEGPTSTATVNITKRADGSYNVSYTPTEPGLYHVHVTLDGKHIPGSIFTVIVLDAESLGGEGKIRVFFSSTSATQKGRDDVFALEKLLTSKKIHLRPDFEPWIPVDILDKEDRDAVFKKAGTKVLPIVFIDDKYVGDYDTVKRLDDDGRLDKLINMMAVAGQLRAEPAPRAINPLGIDKNAAVEAPKVIHARESTKTPDVRLAGGGINVPSSSSSSSSSISAAKPTPAPSSSSARPVPASSSSSSSSKKFCAECGTPGIAGKFCGNCGGKL